MKTYEIDDLDNIPEALQQAALAGETIQVGTCVGWLTVEPTEFLCGVTYRVLGEDII